MNLEQRKAIILETNDIIELKRMNLNAADRLMELSAIITYKSEDEYNEIVKEKNDLRRIIALLNNKISEHSYNSKIESQARYIAELKEALSRKKVNYLKNTKELQERKYHYRQMYIDLHKKSIIGFIFYKIIRRNIIEV